MEPGIALGGGLDAAPEWGGSAAVPAAFDIRQLTVELGGRRVLEDVSMTIPRGRSVAVIGPNGSGKTTLLRCLAGLVRAPGGVIEIEGRPQGQIRQRELARIVSYVPQGEVHADELTVREFVELGRFPHLGPWAALQPGDVAAVAEALRLTETDHLAPRQVGSLSGGERQRVMIAAAIAQGGRILLLDEPTSFLDVRHQMQVIELIGRLHAVAGLTVVTVTHDLNALAAASQQVIALRAGRIAFEGPPTALFTPPVLEDVFESRFARIGRGASELPVVLPIGSGP